MIINISDFEHASKLMSHEVTDVTKDLDLMAAPDLPATQC